MYYVPCTGSVLAYSYSFNYWLACFFLGTSVVTFVSLNNGNNRLFSFKINSISKITQLIYRNGSAWMWKSVFPFFSFPTTAVIVNCIQNWAVKEIELDIPYSTLKFFPFRRKKKERYAYNHIKSHEHQWNKKQWRKTKSNFCIKIFLSFSLKIKLNSFCHFLFCFQ